MTNSRSSHLITGSWDALELDTNTLFLYVVYKRAREDMSYSLEQRTLVLGLCVRTGFVKLKREKFVEQCTVASVPKKLTVQQLVRKWHLPVLRAVHGNICGVSKKFDEWYQKTNNRRYK
jgi:hypothetical protein